MRVVTNSAAGMRKSIAVTLVVLLSSLILTGASLSVNTAADQETQTVTYQFTIGPHKLGEWKFWVYTEGTITITVEWTGPRKLRLLLYGPEQENPYLDVREESPMTKTFTVTSQILAAGQGWKWRVKLGNGSNTPAEGSVSITYPKSLPQINYFKADPLPGGSLPLLSQEPGITRYAAFPTQQFTLSWSVDLAISGITLEYGCGAVAPELAPGITGECGEHGVEITSKRGSRSETITDVGQIYTLKATNHHGTVEAKIKMLPKVWVGYYNATCIDCAPCRDCGKPSEAERLAGFLTEIEEKVRGGCIRNNANLDRFHDPYLRDGLTDDILQAITSLTLYPDDDDLPDAGGRTVCEGAGYGYTPGDKEWIMICLRKGADGLTLLHELEHYVDPNTDECRAPWVAQFCYGLQGPNCP